MKIFFLFVDFGLIDDQRCLIGSYLKKKQRINEDQVGEPAL